MARAKKNKPTVTTILLVVEGPTEKIYFERLKGLERYSSLKIRPGLPKHSNLTTLLDYAKDEQASGAYDYVWLLFDRDVLQTQKLPKTTLDLSQILVERYQLSKELKQTLFNSIEDIYNPKKKIKIKNEKNKRKK